VAVSGGVERDAQESHPREPAEQPHVGAAAERDAVQEDQWNAAAADGATDPMTVIEGHHAVRQPDAHGRFCTRPPMPDPPEYG
jgi:hypothetical protein